MKGDFSRNTFNREKHYAAVLMQQGRVQVDADWNEQQAIHQNRIETEAVDVIGKCGTPKHDAGFAVTAAGSQFNISAGRFYVNGILCENEADVLYDEQPDLPNPPSLEALFANTQTGIIYLDVWKQHLTALNDPAIREVALSGPDTTTRLKTIWQVKTLPISASGDVNCESELTEWDELIAPSTGTLNARTAEPDAGDNPCLIPPDAGYQRLENQLYRIEIHQGSDTGEVTFKYSRDNGSVVTEIKSIDGTEVTVADLGRDDVLGFAKGQWVEVLDDALELNGQPGELLQIDDFTTNGEGLPVIVLASAPTPLTTEPGFPEGVNPDYHPKLRRWDHTTNASSAGVAISTDWLALEGGIQVQFSEGTYRTGDYWLIPARTATGQIEWPVAEDLSPTPQLPLGIMHHYCRLAIAQLLPGNSPNNPTGTLNILEVCDHTFCPLTELDPGESCCTVVVQPGENIQAALDSLPQAGGCVCLKTGIHEIQQPIRIEKSNVVLKGESPGTQVVRPNGLSLLVIATPQNQLISEVVVEQIRFEATGSDPEASDLLDLTLLLMGNCLDIRVQRCRFEVAAQQPLGVIAGLPIGTAIGVAVVNGWQVTLHKNTLSRTVVGVWAERCTACTFSGNRLIGSFLQVSDVLAVPVGYVGFLLNWLTVEDPLANRDCQMVDNFIQDFFLGIVAGVHSDRSKILNNHIRRQATTQLPIESPNNQFFANNEPYIYGIITRSAHCVIVGNFVDLNSPSYGGIRVYGAFNRIEHNTLQSNLTRQLFVGSTQLPVSIFLGQLIPNTDPPNLPESDHNVVEGNQLTGTLTGIGAANVDGTKIIGNQITIFESQTAPSIGVALASTRNSVVMNNYIQGADTGIFLLGAPPTEGINNRITENHIINGTYGIGALSETLLEVSGNVIENMTLAGFAAANLIENASLTHNRIDHCGYRPPTPALGAIAATPSIGAGFFIVSVLGNLTVESCQVINTGISQQGEVAQGSTLWGIAIGLVLACQINQNKVFYTNLDSLANIDLSPVHRALLIVGWLSSSDSDIRYPLLGNALVTNNFFQGVGLPHLVEFFKNPNVPQAGFEQTNFSHNQCFHLQTQTNQPPVGLSAVGIRQANATVSTWGRQIVATGNHIKANNPNFPSLDLSNPEQATLMSNIASGSIFNFGTGVKPSSPEDFNVYPS